MTLVDRVHRVTDGLTDDEQRGLSSGRGRVDNSYDKVNKEARWQVLRTYSVGGRILNGIKGMYVNSITCVRIKGCEGKCFRIDSGVRQSCFMSS